MQVPHAERTSTLVDRLVREQQGNEVSIGTIVDALRDRGFGVLMIMFALPNAVIPGLSVILGLPIILIGLQIAVGRTKPWLPGFMLRRKLSPQMFDTIAQRVSKFLSWIERWMKPRLTWLASGVFTPFLGLFLAFTAIVLMAPIPFGNALPAFSIAFISIGLIEKDGIAILIGIVLGVVGAVFIGSVIGGAVYAAMRWLGL